MITIKDTGEFISVGKNSNYLNCGTAFRGKVAGRRGIFLKIFGGVVFLNNPVDTWINQTLYIDDYTEVDLFIDVKDK